MFNKETQYSGDYFPKQIATKYHEDQVDPKRIKRMEILAENYPAKETKN